MNNQCVPDFVVPTNIALPNQSGENEMEQSWRNIHLLDRNSYTKPPSSNSVDTTPPPLPAPAATNNQLDMTDDEMNVWLHHPLDDFYTEPTRPNPTLAPLPPTTVRPPENSVTNGSRLGFPLISRIVEPLERRRSGFTVVDSNDTPITSGGMATVGPIEATPAAAAGVTDSTTAAVDPDGGDKVEAGEEVTTSPSSSSVTATTTGTASTTGVICQKRKIEEIEESFAATTAAEGPATAPARIEWIITAVLAFFLDFIHYGRLASCGGAVEYTFFGESEALLLLWHCSLPLVSYATHAPSLFVLIRIDVESDKEKKHSRGSSGTKRTRSADVHNQSERRRRDRINEKMKALQALIPRCIKSDKASMLDEAIEYMKQLQTQIQIMSVGYGMMYAGMQQQYAPLMGTAMGMGMGMDMGMSRPVMATPYPPAIPASAAAVPSPGTNVMLPLAPRLPIPPYALPCVQPSTPADSTGNQYAIQIPGMTQIANTVNSCQPYLSYPQIQMQAVQSSTVNQPFSSKPSARKSEGEDEDEEDI